MKSICFPRVAQALSVLVVMGALLAASAIISALSRVFNNLYDDLLGGKPLPELTSTVLSVGPYALLWGFAAAIISLVVAFLLARNAKSVEVASSRLLILVSVLWVLCFAVLSVASVSFALPLLRTTYEMTDSPAH